MHRIFISNTIAVAVFLTGFDLIPLTGQTNENRFSWRMGGGASAERLDLNARPDRFLFTEAIYTGPALKSRVFLERSAIDPDIPGAHRLPSYFPFIQQTLDPLWSDVWIESYRRKTQRVEDQITGSIRLENSFFLLSAGNRYLPDAKSGFLLDHNRISLLKDVQSGRTNPSAFIGMKGNQVSGGLFALQDRNGPGIYFLREGKNSLSFFYHPPSKQASMGLSLKDQKGNFLLSASIDKNERTTTGYIRNEIYFAPLLQVQWGAERRESWDYQNFEAGTFAPNRKGRSGLFFFQIRNPEGIWELEFSGMDRRQEGMRVAHSRLRFLSSPSCGCNLFLSASWKRFSVYHPENSLQKDRGAGGGLFLLFPGFLFRLEALFHKHASPLIQAELSTLLFDGKLSLAAAYFAGKSYKSSFVLLHTDPVFDTGMKFYPKSRGRIYLRYSSSRLSVILSSSETEDAFIAIQGKIKLYES